MQLVFLQLVLQLLARFVSCSLFCSLFLWQIGELVVAAAHGVVRISTGPDFPEAKTARQQRTNAGKADEAHVPAQRESSAGPDGRLFLEWGNLIVIEHRLPQDQGFVTSVYGHLDTERLVKAGDIVQPGQVIGKIGRRHRDINGGYVPHLHFGLRDDRLAEIGATLLELELEGKRYPLTIMTLQEDWVTIDVPPFVEGDIRWNLPGQTVTVARQHDRYQVPARVLCHWRRADFPIVGYALTTDGWLDPYRFLKRSW